MTNHRPTLAVLACAAIAACGEPAAPETTLLVHIDRASLDSSATLSVAYSVSNVGSATEYVPACGGRLRPSLERKEGGTWQSFSGSPCRANVSWAPIPITPGTTVTGALGVWSAEPGTYRLVLRYGARGDAPVASAPFAVP